MTYARNHRPNVSDEEILRMMNLGLLVLSRDCSQVLRFRGGRYKPLSIQTNDGRKRINLRFNGWPGPNHRKRTVYLNKLVWMWVNRAVVPDGHVVDHVDQDPGNDSPENLKLMTWEESDRQGRELQGKNGEEELPF